MKTPYVSDLKPGEAVTGVFLVTQKEVRQKKTGEPYLSLMLADKTGDIDSKMWDNAAEALSTFERDSYVRVKGAVQAFQNRAQLTIHRIQPVADSEVEAADFFPASTRDRDEMFRELQGWISEIGNPHIRTLLEAIFADPEIASAYRTAPAAKSVHHAWIGGLIEHVLSMCHLARYCAGHYRDRGYDVDQDLLMAGVLLHDIGKISELSYSRSFGYTAQGHLLGHIVIGLRMVEDKLRMVPDFPPKLRDLLLHLVISHHGELEYGSPKVPVFLEALLLHHIDNMDARMEIMRSMVANDRLLDGLFTGYNQPMERSALKKQKYLEDAGPPPAAPTPVKPAAKDSPFAAKLNNALKS